MANDRAILEHIQQAGMGRRTFVATTAAAAAALVSHKAEAASLAASPPTGFSPFAAPGKVVKVTKAGCLAENGLYPKADDAKDMLTRAMTELTGKKDLVEAVSQFVHKDDKVCVKVNGIALRNMGTNKELVLPFIDAMIASGIKPENITVLEQYANFLDGTRITLNNVPKGVKIAIHNNTEATMDERVIPGVRIRTKFVTALTQSTAVINFALIKDHSICGYTGAMKNMTHGCTINPHDFHGTHASPHIAMLYAQDVIKTRVRLCIADGFKVMCHGGPLWKQPSYVKAHESVYVSTDPVAIDTIGWEVVEKHRADKGLKSLTDEGRPPAYIRTGATLGLGVAERSQIQLKEITV